MSDPSDPLLPRIREILLRDWDPHDASRSEAAVGMYDAYLAPLAELLRTAPSEEAIVDFLHQRENETMCFPSLGTTRLKRPARKLLALRD